MMHLILNKSNRRPTISVVLIKPSTPWPA